MGLGPNARVGCLISAMERTVGMEWKVWSVSGGEEIRFGISGVVETSDKTIGCRWSTQFWMEARCGRVVDLGKEVKQSLS